MKTPQQTVPKLKDALGLDQELWFKFENKHHFGSHKGRAIPLMISEYFKTGITSFVISSSGNAALAAILAANSHAKNKPGQPLTLKVFVGKNIDQNKFKRLLSEAKNGSGISIEQVDNPKQQAVAFEKNTGAKNLRGSSDPIALVGYEALALELSKIENLSAVFIPTSSGTLAEGLHLGFKKTALNPQIHIIQTVACHPIVSYFDEIHGIKTQMEDQKNSLAGAIVDKVGLRKEKVALSVTESNGGAWIARDEDIKTAIDITKKTTDIEISPNSALSVAGLMLALKSGFKPEGAVVCIITGE